MRMQTVCQLALSATLFTGLLTGGVLSPWAATAATYYVATDGNDANPCTESQPCQSIAKGINSLRSGDTLYLRGGTYTEAIDTNYHTIPSGTSWSNATVIASYPGETAVLTPNDNWVVVAITGDTSVRYIILDGLVLDAANVISSGSRGSATGYALFNEVINSKIHNSRGSYGFYIIGHDNLVDNNEIYNNAGFAVHIYDGNFPITSTDNHIISNNTMYNNGFGLGHGAITVGKGRNCLVYNNLIYDNFGGIEVDGADQQIIGNTLYNNGWGIRVSPSSTGTILENNLLD